MLICPKLGERNQQIDPLLIPYLTNRLEIQMTTKDLLSSLRRCEVVISQVSKHTHLDEVVLHLPFTLHTFELFVSSLAYEVKLHMFIKGLERISKQYGIDIGILFHQEHSIELISKIPNGIDKVSDIVNYPESRRIFFLLENCLPCLNDYDTHVVPAFSLLDLVPASNLYSCIDICHIRCYENIFNINLEIPSTISTRVRWIHFSNTIMHDGYRDKSTHSVQHNTEDEVLADLEYLNMNNINTDVVPIICEISERDYNTCPKMRAEIDLLKSIDNKLIISA